MTHPPQPHRNLPKCGRTNPSRSPLRHRHRRACTGADGDQYDNINLHLKNIYAEEELEEKTTTEDYSVVRVEGKRQVTRQIKHHNLDAVLSVGYRVKSKNATQFRRWATARLKD